MTTHIDNARNSQVNYNKKSSAPFTQYGPYTNAAMTPDMASDNGRDNRNKLEVMSDGAFQKYKSPQTMQEFQHSGKGNNDDSLTDNYGMKAAPSYHKMKDRLNSMRKQNASNVASNILGNNIKKPSKETIMRTKSVDSEIDDGTVPIKENVS